MVNVCRASSKQLSGTDEDARQAAWLIAYMTHSIVSRGDAPSLCEKMPAPNLSHMMWYHSQQSGLVIMLLWLMQGKHAQVSFAASCCSAQSHPGTPGTNCCSAYTCCLQVMTCHQHAVMAAPWTPLQKLDVLF